MRLDELKKLDIIAKELVLLRNQALNSNNKELIAKYEKFQRECIDKFKCLVLNRVRKYRQFPNYEDLEQDGLEALILALRTYKWERGSFTWWADKYISTRVSRAANTHSTIRFPLKKARELKPFKVAELPILIDGKIGAIDSIEYVECIDKIRSIIDELPELHKKVVCLAYGFKTIDNEINGNSETIDNILKILDITKSKYLKVLREAKNKIREKLKID